jgi:glycerophosphoryl diester phosphodiesterase
MLVNIELKNIESEPDFDPAMRIVDRLLDVLAERPADERRRWLVSSFSWSTLERCRAAMPAVPTAWLVLDASEDVVRRAAVAGDLALHPWVGAVTEEVVARCHDAGLAVHAWTCNDAARLVELADAGVDGVCTDVPDVALGALGRPADGDAPAVSPRWGRRA